MPRPTPNSVDPRSGRSDATDLLLADELELTGDVAGATALYERIGGGAQSLPPGLAWRHGMALYLWGNPREALAVFVRGALDSEDTSDEALLLAWRASAHWLTGEVSECRSHAQRAFQVAQAARDDRALATAHVALALCANLDGDPAALHMHYTKGLTLAEAAGDATLAARIRSNLACGLEREARYGEALEMLVLAVADAEKSGHVVVLARALSNAATLCHRLGRLEEAATGYRRAVDIYQRIGCRKVAYPLNGLGDLYRQRGRFGEARTAYEEAIRAAVDDDNRQALVPGLTGLARVLATEEPAVAAELVARALECASGSQRTMAEAAAGWVALTIGDVAVALRRAVTAGDHARRHRDHAALAEALELRAAASGPDEARQPLAEALAIWRDGGAVCDTDRIRVLLGQLPGADGEARLQARLAAGRLTAVGLVVPAPCGRGEPAGPAPVEIRTLGQFAVIVDGVPVPTAAWQSRKARDLLRILVSRRGRPIARDQLIELLWGGVDDGNRMGHRLAVLLSTVRGVLDPQRLGPADHFVTANTANIALNVDRLTVDVEVLLSDADHGLRLARHGHPADARAVLAGVERAHTGDFCADDPYDDWSAPLRDEVRAAYQHVLRVLADLARSAGDPDDAVRHLTRLLATDEYDERAHRDLVAVLTAAMRHGEAHRARLRYLAAMRQIGVEPAR